MHDILQEMGREVVRQESSEDPSKRSRLWDPDDICYVLKNDKGTDAIRSIRVDLSSFRKLKLSPHVFAKMTNLRYLDFIGKYDLELLPQGLQSFPTDLRYICWIHYPLKSFPKKFSGKNLVILDFSHSRVENLWCGVQDLVNLKEVRLTSSRFLKELPDFSKATNLKVLNITDCLSLESVHPSIFSLEKLVQLDLSHCFSLTTFTSNSHLSSLLYLNLGSCISLRTFSVTTNNLIKLDLTDIGINELPSLFRCQSKLEILVLRKSEIEIIPSSIQNLTRLRKLDIRYCLKLLALPVLPLSVETLLVECISLKTVLFPSTISEQFKENKKRIEFWNCFNLDEHSLVNIGFNMKINLIKFAYQHLLTLEHDDYVDSYADYEYNHSSYQALYVYPGSSVPEWLEYKTESNVREWLEYKTTEDDMIVNISPLHLSSLLGFVFCFVLAKVSNYCYKIVLNITAIDVEGDGEKDGVDIYMDVDRVCNNSDHVCMIYDPPFSQYLTRIAKNHTRFKIKVAARTKPNFQRGSSKVELKGFGISPINHSTYHNLKKWKLFDYCR
ncbi:putative leucine-rich repeat domain, L domain-containing protein [Medicago truncatula]|uniref:Putative leucine-rich repeat domain, L domain-containing protein n=1 Tax=Medicago truncatula TaxID=3880 RepID=A0A396I799_MEDTR|nr:putative leucine-rich repeat domain, L domain-containing protein [Medicago truncatula]